MNNAALRGKEFSNVESGMFLPPDEQMCFSKCSNVKSGDVSQILWTGVLVMGAVRDRC